MKKFVILAHPRCGSTSLCRLLDVHPEIKVDQEPYNPGRVNWVWNHYCPHLDLDKGLTPEETFEKIFANFTGFKHMHYHVNHDLNKAILNYAEKIIYITRNNLLQAAVSHEISNQTGNWQGGKDSNKDHVFSPLRISFIETELTRVAAQNSFYESYMKSNDIEFFKLEYGQFYSGAEQEKIKHYQEVLKYLEVSPLAEKKFSEIMSIFSLDNKIGGVDLYKRIPNIDEINQMFGKDYGYLF
jgi:LPS sulfotransferase NodH